jgi:hypothetical protein
MDTQEKAEILERAADVIHTRGHYKGNYENTETGAVCAIGAIRIARWGRSFLACPLERIQEDNLLDELLGAVVGSAVPRHIDIAYWNDLVETTQEQVEDWLKSAAKALCNKGS